MNPGTGRLTTPAGPGARGPLGGGGRATRASLGTCGAVVDHSSNLVIADTLHDRIRVVAHKTGTCYGKAMRAGHIYTIGGSGHRPGFSGEGDPAAKAELSFPQEVAVDAAGNLLIADQSNNRMRMVTR